MTIDTAAKAAGEWRATIDSQLKSCRAKAEQLRTDADDLDALAEQWAARKGGYFEAESCRAEAAEVRSQATHFAALAMRWETMSARASALEVGSTYAEQQAAMGDRYGAAVMRYHVEVLEQWLAQQ